MTLSYKALQLGNISNIYDAGIGFCQRDAP